MIKFPDAPVKIIKALYSLNLRDKLSNYIAIEAQKSARSEFVSGYPFWMVIDPANLCTLKCPFCPTGQNRNSRPKTILRFDNFKKIIDQLGPYLIHIDFCNWGEPLLNKDLFKMIKYAKQYQIDIKIDSNLNHLNEKSAEDLILSGLDKLIVSLDGTSHDTYSKYRVGGDFDKAMGNLRRLLKIKQKLKKQNPYISWQFLVFRHNEHEIEDAKKIAKRLGVDHIGITKAFIGDKDWIPLNPEFSNYDQEKLGKIAEEDTSQLFNHSQNKFCNWPWEAIVVNSNGSVSPCCSVEDEKDDFGNLLDNSFDRVWNNEKYLDARRYIKAREKRQENNNICFNCRHQGLINLDILSCHSLFSRR